MKILVDREDIIRIKQYLESASAFPLHVDSALEMVEEILKDSPTIGKGDSLQPVCVGCGQLLHYILAPHICKPNPFFSNLKQQR